METDAEVARERARILTEQARALRDEEQRLARRLEELRVTHPTLHPGQWVRDPSRGPTARTWQPAIGDNLDDVARELEETQAECARVSGARDSAYERAQRLGQLVARCRQYLGLAG